MSIVDILNYRQQFYERFYDLRIICSQLESPESVAIKIVNEYHRYNNRSEFLSTRGMDKCAWNDVLLKGLAEDGGLFMPAGNSPIFSIKEWHRLVDLSYAERAVRILEKWIHPQDVTPSLIREFVMRAYCVDSFGGGSASRVRVLGEKMRCEFVHELFHGQTGSFKDLSLQLFPYFFNEAVRSSDSKLR